MHMTAAAALAYWARRHRVQARFLIAFSTAAIMLLGAALGHLWMSSGLRMGPGVLAGIFAIYLLVFPLYPVLRRRATWMRRKMFDVLLVCCTALLGVWLGAQETVPRLPLEGNIAIAATTTTAPPSVHATSRTPAHRFERRVRQGVSLLRAVFRKPVRFADEPHLFSTGAKIGLSILAVLLMVSLMAVLAAVSCSISCSGNAVGGTLVLILGWAAVLALGTLAIIRINRGETWAERRRGRDDTRAR